MIRLTVHPLRLWEDRFLHAVHNNRRRILSQGPMLNRKLCTGSAVLACLTLVGTVTAAPTFKILYHERLDITPRVDTNGQQHVSFDAYGRHFDIDLELNDNIARGAQDDRGPRAA